MASEMIYAKLQIMVLSNKKTIQKKNLQNRFWVGKNIDTPLRNPRNSIVIKAIANDRPIKTLWRENVHLMLECDHKLTVLHLLIFIGNLSILRFIPSHTVSTFVFLIFNWKFESFHWAQHIKSYLPGQIGRESKVQDDRSSQ